MSTQFDLLINSYLDNKVGIAPGFISESLSKELYNHIIQLQHNQEMKASGIGNEALKDPGQSMRSDKTYWLDKSHNNIYEQEFLHMAENFIAHLNETCYTGINDYEFHYAVYEKDTFYKRHKDQFKDNDTRKYSFIIYLNENWKEEDGGQLRVFKNDGVQKILPQAQTAVFFKSDEMEHEVTIPHRARMSISGWLKRS